MGRLCRETRTKIVDLAVDIINNSDRALLAREVAWKVEQTGHIKGGWVNPRIIGKFLEAEIEKGRIKVYNPPGRSKLYYGENCKQIGKVKVCS